MTCCPSATRAARLTAVSSARGSGPPACCSASATRAAGVEAVEAGAAHGARDVHEHLLGRLRDSVAVRRPARRRARAHHPPPSRRRSEAAPRRPRRRPAGASSASVASTAATAQITTVPRPPSSMRRPYEGRALHVGDECQNGATISPVERFKAILGGEEGEAPTVELPFDAKERFGKARAPVRGTVNGTGLPHHGRGLRRRLPDRLQARAARARRHRDRRRGRGDRRARRGAAHGRAAARAGGGARRGRRGPGRLRRPLVQPPARVRRMDRRGQARRHPRAPRRRGRSSGSARPPASARRSRSAPPGSPTARSTRSTSAPRGPCRAQSTIEDTASGLPSKTASTAPSERLQTQPVTPSREARRRVESRKKTPWTRPCTTTRLRTVSLIESVRALTAGRDNDDALGRRLGVWPPARRAGLPSGQLPLAARPARSPAPRSTAA